MVFLYRNRGISTLNFKVPGFAIKKGCFAHTSYKNRVVFKVSVILKFVSKIVVY